MPQHREPLRAAILAFAITGASRRGVGASRPERTIRRNQQGTRQAERDAARIARGLERRAAQSAMLAECAVELPREDELRSDTCGDRQRNDEFSAAAHTGSEGGDRSAVQFDQPPSHRQPDLEPADVRAPRAKRLRISGNAPRDHFKASKDHWLLPVPPARAPPLARRLSCRPPAPLPTGSGGRGRPGANHHTRGRSGPSACRRSPCNR
jgi:hypothetical protein